MRNEDESNCALFPRLMLLGSDIYKSITVNIEPRLDALENLVSGFRLFTFIVFILPSIFLSCSR